MSFISSNTSLKGERLTFQALNRTKQDIHPTDRSIARKRKKQNCFLSSIRCIPSRVDGSLLTTTRRLRNHSSSIPSIHPFKSHPSYPSINPSFPAITQSRQNREITRNDHHFAQIHSITLIYNFLSLSLSLSLRRRRDRERKREQITDHPSIDAYRVSQKSEKRPKWPLSTIPYLHSKSNIPLFTRPISALILTRRKKQNLFSKARATTIMSIQHSFTQLDLASNLLTTQA